jgi:hypothetical protein
MLMPTDKYGKTITLPAAAVGVPAWLLQLKEHLENRTLRGHNLAMTCGHPGWKNVWRSCGDVEIEIDEDDCERCKVISLSGGEHL